MALNIKEDSIYNICQLTTNATLNLPNTTLFEVASSILYPKGLFVYSTDVCGILSCTK